MLEGYESNNISLRSSIEKYGVHIGRPSDTEPYRLEITNPDTNIKLELGELTAEDVTNLSSELRNIIPHSRDEKGEIDVQKLRIAITQYLNPRI